MTELTRGEKTQANKGIRKDILEVVLTSPKAPTASKILEEVKRDWPHADIKTVGNCLSLLARRNEIRKGPWTKGDRGPTWWPPLSEIKFPPKPAKEAHISPEEVGRAIITAISNMKKRIEEQLDRIHYLEKTLKNHEGSAKLIETTLRNKIRERDQIIASLKAQLEPDPALMFKLSDIANYTGEVKKP